MIRVGTIPAITSSSRSYPPRRLQVRHSRFQADPRQKEQFSFHSCGQRACLSASRLYSINWLMKPERGLCKKSHACAGQVQTFAHGRAESFIRRVLGNVAMNVVPANTFMTHYYLR